MRPQSVWVVPGLNGVEAGSSEAAPGTGVRGGADGESTGAVLGAEVAAGVGAVDGRRLGVEAPQAAASDVITTRPVARAAIGRRRDGIGVMVLAGKEGPPSPQRRGSFVGPRAAQVPGAGSTPPSRRRRRIVRGGPQAERTSCLLAGRPRYGGKQAEDRDGRRHRRNQPQEELERGWPV